MNCKECGSDVEKFHEENHENREGDIRREERYFCKGCDREGKVFSNNGPTVRTGILR